MKICRTCNINLESTKFYKSENKYLFPDCIKCHSNNIKEQNYPCIEGNHICTTCKIEQPSDNFGKRKDQKNGYNNACKKCRKQMRQKLFLNLDSYIRYLYKELQIHAKKRKIEVHITIDDIMKQFKIQDGICMLSNIKMTHQSADRVTTERIINPYNISVDRIDSSKDYTIDNIQLVCVIVNRMKLFLEDDQFLLLCGAIKEHNENNSSFIRDYINNRQ